MSATMERSELDKLAETLEAIGHPTRMRVLFSLEDDVASPSELAVVFSDHCSLGSMAYHFRRLANDGQIRLRRTARRRGAIEHYYGLTPRGQATVDKLRELMA